MINRSAYNDRGSQLKETYQKLGYQVIIDQPNYFGFRLRPRDKPELPHVDRFVATYGKGFYGQESDGSSTFRWADSDGLIRIAPSLTQARQATSGESGMVLVSFGVQSLDDRSVWLEVGSSRALVSSPDDKSRQVKLEIESSALPVRLHIFSDKPGVSPGNGDLRKLAFQVRNLRIELVK